MSESLAETYENRFGEFESPRHFYIGIALFATGVLLVVAGIVFATTDLFAAFGFGNLELKEFAGITAGLGVPATFLGVFTVLPQNTRRMKRATALGVFLCAVGVLFFEHAYPHHWNGYGNDYTFYVVSVYFVGVVLTFWSTFAAIVNFKTRNDPGGTVKMKVTRNGETQLVEVDRSELRQSGAGALGFIGETPDGDVETQTNKHSTTTTERSNTNTSTNDDSDVISPSSSTEWPDPGRDY